MKSESAIPAAPVCSPLAWPRALALAAAAVYGPQLVMGFYTSCAVHCPHCRATVGKMLVLAPGVEIAVTLCWLLKIHHPTTDDTVNLLVVIALSIFALATVTALLRLQPRWRWPMSAAIALVFGAEAFLLLAMIRA